MAPPTQPGQATLHDHTNLSALTAEQEAHLSKLEAAAGQQPVARLNSGFDIPLVGLGTWKSAGGEVGAAVASALRAGYRHIDCARIYGNEHEVGDALEAAFAEGVVQRSQVFITSKLWNTEHAADKVEEACRKTLADLKLSYLDLYLVHWPVSGNTGPTLEPPYTETWAAMEALVEKGLVRSVGVSNMSPTKLKALLDGGARITPAVNQVEAHPYWRNDGVLAFCKEHGIHVTAYSPLGSPDSAAMLKRGADVPTPLQDAAVGAVAAALGKSAGQVLIRWAIQRGTSVLPKSVKPERIAANLDVLSWEIPQEHFEKLSSLDHQMRMVDGSFFLNPQGPYKTLADLWDE